MEQYEKTKDLTVFSELTGIRAGFTLRPDLSIDRRDIMRRHAAESGGLVARPCLVHGTRIVRITEEMKTVHTPYLELEDTDGLVTDVPDVTLTSTHGDCLPIWICRPTPPGLQGRPSPVIGLAHAGWRGTVRGIAFELAKAVTEGWSCFPEDLTAYIGPGIGPCCFQVSRDVRDEFLDTAPWSAPWITCDADSGGPKDKYHINLASVNAGYLRLAGVEKISISPLCTCCRSDLFYSFRRDSDSRRMLAYITIQN